MGGEGHIFDMITRMRDNQQLLKSRRERIRDLRAIYLSHYNVHTSRHESPANLENIKIEIRKEIRQKRIKSRIITGVIMAIVFIIILVLYILIPWQNFSNTFIR